jgi:hypothetical protein
MLSILNHFVTRTAADNRREVMPHGRDRLSKSSLEEMHHITSKRRAAIQCSKQNGGGGGTVAAVARRRRAPTHRFKILSEWGRGSGGGC